MRATEAAREKKRLLAKIDASKRGVTAAEEQLARVIRDTRRAKRSEKTTISDALEEAIAKLRVARAELSDLAKLVAGGAPRG